MTRLRTGVFLALVVLAIPGIASAQGGLIDFFESLSGPGPYRGGGVVWRLACMRADTDDQSFRGAPLRPWIVDGHCLNDLDVERRGGKLVLSEVRQIVELRALWASTPEGERPVLLADPADTRNVNLFKLDMVAAFRVAPFLDVGGGGGLIRFSVAEGPEGPAKDLYRPVLVPISLTFSPMGVYHSGILRDESQQITGVTGGAKWRRFVRIRFDVNYIPFGFTPKSWGKDSTLTTADYSTDGNWVLSGGVIFDVGTLIGLGR